MCFKAEKMTSNLPPPTHPPKKVQILIRGWEKNDTFFIDRKEKKKKGRREGEKKERRERKEEKEEERRKERKKGGKKRNVNVFFGLKMGSTLSPPPIPKVQIQIRGWEKMTHFCSIMLHVNCKIAVFHEHSSTYHGKDGYKG